MRKINSRIAALLSASALLAALLAGCAQAAPAPGGASSALYPAATQAASAPAVTSQAAAQTPDSTPAASQAVTPAVSQAATPSAASATGGAGTLLSEEQARQIVLDHAGLTQDQVNFVTFKMDQERGRTEYELEFYAGNEEYDYEIDASTGEILSFDRDLESRAPTSAQTQTGTLISAEDAQNTALTHAGLAQADVTGLRAQLDRDDGRQVYEVEFYAGYTEYDYEIDASSGEIISYSSERD